MGGTTIVVGEHRQEGPAWSGHNRLWRVETTEGSVAVEEVRSRLPGDTERPFQIELAASAAGIPAARPIPSIDGRCFAVVDDADVRCNAWVDGEVETNEDADASDAERMGGIVARLHGLRLDAGPDDPGGPFGRDHWLGLARRAPAASRWAAAVRDGIDLIERAERSARWAHDDALIGSHRDLNAHNVLFTADDLVLIDWEAAGASSARYERAVFASLWGSSHDGSMDLDTTSAFLRGYREAGGYLEPDDPEALAIWLGGLIWWTEQNLHLALDRVGEDQDQLAAGLVRAVMAGPETVAIRRAFLSDALTRA